MSTTAIKTASNEALILTGSGYGLEIAPEYIKLRDDLIEEFKAIGKINNPEDDARAADLIARADKIRITTEKSRTKVKAPALDFGRTVDANASEFINPLKEVADEAKKERGEYFTAVQAERQRVLREMEAARQAEAKRIADEEAAQRAAAEAAEKARIAAEEAEWNATTPEDEAKAKAAADEAAKLEAARVAAAQAQAEKIAATPPPAPAFIPEAPKGVKMVADFEVVDLDALYRHNVGLVKMEPRREEILRAIAGQTSGETLPTIPGLRVFLKPQVR